MEVMKAKKMNIAARWGWWSLGLPLGIRPAERDFIFSKHYLKCRIKAMLFSWLQQWYAIFGPPSWNVPLCQAIHKPAQSVNSALKIATENGGTCKCYGQGT